ncbi:aminotransferase class V-fold PLP-dependent enzyme [Helicobacter sp. 11S03491-1]|uniref:aminotransferase class V-fold PLP-dependent enzyme n=1 Tax=Helicobacter sp. 11S03491-1 TaxID=1476196 RepID=UPI000BA5B1D0|nr:aminotransferase class V-fold PLP-dependent enzyme [Helicobacter sp. 11S03491-1]PAF42556.1 cysteine desulfurase [Helicobacter sp. 11S03491-1]
MLDKNKILDNLFDPLLDPNEDKLAQVREGVILKKDTRYFDWTASGLAHTLVEKRIKKLLPYYANTHSDASSHAQLMGGVYERSKKALKKSLGLSDDFVLLCAGYGATGAIKKFQEILGIYIPSKTKNILTKKLKDLNFPKVLIGPYEHHSNEISWREGLCEVTRLPLSSEGLFDLKSLENSLKSLKKTDFKINSFNLASNVTGIFSPYEEISALSKKYNAFCAFDMASSSAHTNIDSNLYDACFLSPHKLLGGVGTNGVLAMRKQWIPTDISPSFAGGGVIKYANRESQEYFDDIEIREEAGTPGLLQMYRCALAYMLRDEYSLEAIRRRENILTQSLLHGLSSIPALKIYGNLKAHRIGIVSLNVGGISPYDLAYILSNIYHIETRAGCSCAGPYGHDLLGMEDSSFEALKLKPGWLRISLHYTHSLEDVEYLLDSLKKAIKKLRGV